MSDNPMKTMAAKMLPELLDACGGYAGPLKPDPVTISADLAHGLLSLLGACVAGLADDEGNDALRASLLLGHTLAMTALEDAAEIADGDASLYGAHAARDRDAFERLGHGGGLEERTRLLKKADAAERDAITCTDLARRIRALKAERIAAATK